MKPINSQREFISAIKETSNGVGQFVNIPIAVASACGGYDTAAVFCYIAYCINYDFSVPCTQYIWKMAENLGMTSRMFAYSLEKLKKLGYVRQERGVRSQKSTRVIGQKSNHDGVFLYIQVERLMEAVKLVDECGLCGLLETTKKAYKLAAVDVVRENKIVASPPENGLFESQNGSEIGPKNENFDVIPYITSHDDPSTSTSNILVYSSNTSIPRKNEKKEGDVGLVTQTNMFGSLDRNTTNIDRSTFLNVQEKEKKKKAPEIDFEQIEVSTSLDMPENGPETPLQSIKTPKKGSNAKRGDKAATGASNRTDEEKALHVFFMRHYDGVLKNWGMSLSSLSQTQKQQAGSLMYSLIEKCRLICNDFFRTKGFSGNGKEICPDTRKGIESIFELICTEWTNLPEFHRTNTALPTMLKNFDQIWLQTLSCYARRKTQNPRRFTVITPEDCTKHLRAYFRDRFNLEEAPVSTGDNRNLQFTEEEISVCTDSNIGNILYDRQLVSRVTKCIIARKYQGDYYGFINWVRSNLSGEFPPIKFQV